MIRTNRPLRLAPWIFLGILLIGLPACQSPDGRFGGWRPQPTGDTSNLVYRPILTRLERPNPLYLSNYAGDDESPMRPRRTMMGAPVTIPPDEPRSVTLQHGSWDNE